YQVAPAELEAVLIGNPDIADAAVIGVKDDATGEELPKAFIVRAPGSSISEQEVMDYAASRLAPHKKLRAVEFIEQLPTSAAGQGGHRGADPAGHVDAGRPVAVHHDEHPVAPRGPPGQLLRPRSGGLRRPERLVGGQTGRRAAVDQAGAGGAERRAQVVDDGA